jgi:hypothetical protein
MWNRLDSMMVSPAFLGFLGFVLAGGIVLIQFESTKGF